MATRAKVLAKIEVPLTEHLFHDFRRSLRALLVQGRYQPYPLSTSTATGMVKDPRTMELLKSWALRIARDTLTEEVNGVMYHYPTKQHAARLFKAEFAAAKAAGKKAEREAAKKAKAAEKVVRKVTFEVVLRDAEKVEKMLDDAAIGFEIFDDVE